MNSGVTCWKKCFSDGSEERFGCCRSAAHLRAVSLPLYSQMNLLLAGHLNLLKGKFAANDYAREGGNCPQRETQTSSTSISASCSIVQISYPTRKTSSANMCCTTGRSGLVMRTAKVVWLRILIWLRSPILLQDHQAMQCHRTELPDLNKQKEAAAPFT